MIEKMRKYSFVLYHRDYEAFLAQLQKLGVLHLIRNTEAKTESLVKNLELIGDFAEATSFLQKLASEAEKTATALTPKMLLNKITEAARRKTGWGGRPKPCASRSANWSPGAISTMSWRKSWKPMAFRWISTLASKITLSHSGKKTTPSRR
jgi:predicted RecB family endonuclease